jgi:hypothetical protein
MGIYLEDKENYEGQDIGTLAKHIIKHWDGHSGLDFVDTLTASVTIEILTPEGVIRKCKVRFDNIIWAEGTTL